MIAAVIYADQGQRRPIAVAEGSRGGPTARPGEDPQPYPLGFPPAGRAARASICIQASSAHTIAVISLQIQLGSPRPASQ